MASTESESAATPTRDAALPTQCIGRGFGGRQSCKSHYTSTAHFGRIYACHEHDICVSIGRARSWRSYERPCAEWEAFVSITALAQRNRQRSSFWVALEGAIYSRARRTQQRTRQPQRFVERH